MFPPEDVGIEVCEGCLFLSVFLSIFFIHVIPVMFVIWAPIVVVIRIPIVLFSPGNADQNKAPSSGGISAFRTAHDELIIQGKNVSYIHI